MPKKTERWTLAKHSKATGYWSAGYMTFGSYAEARADAARYNKTYGYAGYKAKPIRLSDVPKNKLWKTLGLPKK